MVNNKVVKVTISGYGAGKRYYTDAPDDWNFIDDITSCIFDEDRTSVKILDQLPDGKTAFGSFKECCEEVNPNYFKDEATRLTRVHDKLVNYLSSQKSQD